MDTHPHKPAEEMTGATRRIGDSPPQGGRRNSRDNKDWTVTLTRCRRNDRDNRKDWAVTLTRRRRNDRDNRKDWAVTLTRRQKK